MIKTMSKKMTANSQLSTTESKKQKQKQTKQTIEQEWSHRNRDYLEGYQLGEGKGRMGEIIQGSRSITDRYKIDRGSLRTE